MTSQINFCRCAWETCEQGLGAGFWVAVVLGPICGIICLSFTAWYCCVKCRKRNEQQALLMGQNCKHEFEAVECVELAKRTGNNLYLEGYICDVCKGSFSVTHKPTHCFKCGMDFCDGCLANLGGGIQELPPYSEPTSAACLENAAHAACTSLTMCSSMDASYATGFICDACHGQFPENVKFERCTICRLDFCAGCSLRRAKSSAPPSEEPWSPVQKDNTPSSMPPYVSVELVSMEPVPPSNGYSHQDVPQVSNNNQGELKAAGGYSSPQAGPAPANTLSDPPVNLSGPPANLSDPPANLGGPPTNLSDPQVNLSDLPDNPYVANMKEMDGFGDLPANPFVAKDDGSGYTNFQDGSKQTDGYSNLQDDSFAVNNNSPSTYY